MVRLDLHVVIAIDTEVGRLAQWQYSGCRCRWRWRCRCFWRWRWHCFWRWRWQNNDFVADFVAVEIVDETIVCVADPLHRYTCFVLCQPVAELRGNAAWCPWAETQSEIYYIIKSKKFDEICVTFVLAAATFVTCRPKQMCFTKARGAHKAQGPCVSHG